MTGSDAELMKQVVAGEAAAFEMLTGRHGPEIRARLRQILRNGTAADDVYQEVLLRLWTQAQKWEGRGTLAGWLLRMATNLALNHLRGEQRRRQRPLELTAEDGEDDEIATPGWLVDTASLRPDEIVDQAEQGERMRDLVAELPEQKQEVLRLVYDADMEIREVGNYLGIPAGTVKSRLHYARAELARAWEEREALEEQ